MLIVKQDRVNKSCKQFFLFLFKHILTCTVPYCLSCKHIRLICAGNCELNINTALMRVTLSIMYSVAFNALYERREKKSLNGQYSLFFDDISLFFIF